MSTPLDAVTVYKGQIESTLRANGTAPKTWMTADYVAEVDIQVDKDGQLQRSRLEKRLRATSNGMTP